MEKPEILELKSELKALKLEIEELKEEIRKIKESENNTGVYLDGCPDYAREYISKSIKKKEGE